MALSNRLRLFMASAHLCGLCGGLGGVGLLSGIRPFQSPRLVGLGGNACGLKLAFVDATTDLSRPYLSNLTLICGSLLMQ